MKTYSGFRLPLVGARVIIEGDGKARMLPLRLDLRGHSPTGVEWGYGGSGPAQLALALLADATGDEIYAVARYVDYKDEVVARMPSGPGAIPTGQVWTLSQAEIQAWAAANPCSEADREWVRAELEEKREYIMQRERDARPS
mgnify:CR=1 FL=1